MSMVIGTNVASLSAQRQIGMAVRDQGEAMERLSSGKRINSAKDDAAGLGISNSMTSQIRGLDQAVRNANDGISMIQTAEGALDQTTNILQRMRELSVQSANGTYNDSENRASLDAEFKQLLAEIDRIAENTEFNGKTLLNGDQKNGVAIQVGDQSNQTVKFEIDAMDTKSLGMGSTSVDVVGSAMVLTAGSSFSSAGSVSIGYNDVLINGQSVIAAGGSEFVASADSVDNLVNAINDNVNGVSASLIASTEIALSGDGNISTTEEITVALVMADDTTLSYKIRDADSITEIVDKLNDTGGGKFTAAINDDGKFVVTAEGVKTITVTDGGSALGAGGSATAALALTSSTGDPITVERGSTGSFADLATLGLRESSVSGTVEGNGMTAASTAWGVGDVSINGVVINEGVTAGSLATKVDAINAVSSQTGVTAEAFVTAELDLSSVSTFSSAALDINGTLTTALSSGATIADLATAINNQSDLTGIKATMSGQNILLEGNSSAMNIAIASAASAAVINTTIASSASITITKGDNISAGIALVGMSGGSTSYKTVYGGLKLTSDTGNPISIDLGTAASIAEHGLLEANNVGAAAGGAALSSLSVDSATNAQKAIDVIDNALNTVNGQRGDLGAVNNRLEFTVDNLQSVSQQTSAARSRILDADFAKESASLSRAQVLQQAGTAMLAQANSAPQQVLSILR